MADSRTLGSADRAAAGAVLAEAFQDDPMWVILYDGPGRRRQLLTQFFVALTEVSIDRGNAIGVGEPLQGVALWGRPPGASGSVSLRSLALWLPFRPPTPPESEHGR